MPAQGYSVQASTINMRIECIRYAPRFALNLFTERGVLFVHGKALLCELVATKWYFPGFGKKNTPVQNRDIKNSKNGTEKYKLTKLESKVYFIIPVLKKYVFTIGKLWFC